jgi:hypothetical protein
VDRWRFYQGLRNEWRWYQLGESGQVVDASDQGFEELPACMANAAEAGFDHHSYRVHARERGALDVSSL